MYCNSCHFSCKKMGDWNRHLKTKKHLRMPELNELKKLIEEQQKQICKLQEMPTIQVTQKFNLNIFLQENCTNAMNWDEFMHTLQMNPEGLTPSICDGITELGVYKRPIHCIDLKRKKMCIKNENIWEHDDIKVQTKLSETTAKIIKEWERSHPTWFNNEAEIDVYTRLLTTDLTDISKTVFLNKN